MTESTSTGDERTERLFEVGPLSLSSTRIGPVQTLSLSGELDLASVDTVENELLRAEAQDVRTIVLDLAGLTFLDSSGIRFLIAAVARSRADSCRLVMRRPPEVVRRVLRIAGVDDRLPFSD